MRSATTIDIDALLLPVPSGKLPGQDGREGTNYGMLKEARRQEDPINDEHFQRPGKSPDWQKVIQLSTKIVVEEGKDLEVVVWLVEAVVKKHGITGVRDGLRLLLQLHEKCWAEIFPILTEAEDLEARSTRLEALNKLLPAAIRTLPLIHPPGGPSYSAWDYQKGHQGSEKLKAAIQAAKTEEQRSSAQQALQEARELAEKVDQAVASTPLSHYSALLALLNESWEAFQHLNEVLSQKYGEDGPSLREVGEAIEECRDLLDRLVRKKGGVGLKPEASDTSAVKDQDVANRPDGGFMASGDPRDRAEALKQLSRVAEFFRRTEPHSPVSYLVQRAARWGEMPLEEWLREVIRNEGVLGEVKETLGLTQNQSGNNPES
jgi:type VI secretion system protein ImpA